LKAVEYEMPVYYRRTVTRHPNEEGMFKRLQNELSVIAQEYGVPEDEIHPVFIGVSCSKSKLMEVLKG
jgi:hypothetical protein